VLGLHNQACHSKEEKVMHTIQQLMDGTKKVLPTALENAPAVNFDEIGKAPGLISPYLVYSGKTENNYHTSIKIQPAKNFMESEVQVRCSCKAYYHYAWRANHMVGSHLGEVMPPYERKTDTRPPKNPQKIACLCKHEIALAAYIQKESRKS